MHGRVIDHVLHLMNEPHGVRVAAEQLERQLSIESLLISSDMNRARPSTNSPQRSFNVGRSAHASVDHNDHASAFAGERPFHLSHQIHSAPAICTSVPKMDL